MFFFFVYSLRTTLAHLPPNILQSFMASPGLFKTQFKYFPPKYNFVDLFF